MSSLFCLCFKRVWYSHISFVYYDNQISLFDNIVQYFSSSEYYTTQKQQAKSTHAHDYKIQNKQHLINQNQPHQQNIYISLSLIVATLFSLRSSQTMISTFLLFFFTN